MAGPADRSACNDADSPQATAITPITDASNAMVSGVVAQRRAVAAGITNSAVINSMPTILMAIAITPANNNR